MNFGNCEKIFVLRHFIKCSNLIQRREKIMFYIHKSPEVNTTVEVNTSVVQ